MFRVASKRVMEKVMSYVTPVPNADLVQLTSAAENGGIPSEAVTVSESPSADADGGYHSHGTSYTARKLQPRLSKLAPK